MNQMIRKVLKWKLRKVQWKPACKNLLAEICRFNTQKYTNLESQASSNSFLYVGYSSIIKYSTT